MSDIHIYKDILFDSREELYFAVWLDELIEEGYVKDWKRYNNTTDYWILFNPFKLSYSKETVLKTKTKTEIKSFTILNDLTYTPDFSVEWTDKGMQKFVSGLRLIDKLDPKSSFFFDGKKPNTTYVEIKPAFDQNDRTAKFSIIQKIIWNTQRSFVDLIKIPDLFKDTFLPKLIIDDFKYKVISKKAQNKGKKKGDFKVDWEVRTLEQFLKINEK